MFSALILGAAIAQATPAPACANPNESAAVLRVSSIEEPDSAKSLVNKYIVALVRVTVGPSGNLLAASIYESTGDAAMDRVALAEARAATYAPQLVHCVPTKGDFLFRVAYGSPALPSSPQFLLPAVGTATRMARCAVPDEEASPTNQVFPDDDVARRAGDPNAVVLVYVHVGAAGNVIDATIYTSSANAAIDREAITVARQSTYAPKLAGCVPAQGDYLMRVEFGLSPTPPPPPRFVAPPGWIAAAIPRAQRGPEYTYGSWKKDGAFMSFEGWRNTGSMTLKKTQRLIAATTKNENRRILVSDIERVCSGTQDALLVTFEGTEVNAPHAVMAELFIASSDMEYEFSYGALGLTSIDPAVMQAIQSLCVPDK